MHAVASYLGATREDDAYSLFHTALLAVDRYQADLRRVGVSYAANLLDMISALGSLVRSHFEEGPFSRPATLEISPSGKKYPFHTPGLDVRLEVLVSNRGTGFALSTDVRCIECESLVITQARLFIGTVRPNAEMRIDIRAQVASPTEFAVLILEVRWKNIDGTSADISAIVEFSTQQANVDWLALEQSDPYHLEPVTTAHDLVGRDEQIGRLLSKVRPGSVGSAFVFGQKRVGKTSIAKTLLARLKSESMINIVTVYLESGDYICPDPAKTIESLGRKLCNGVRLADRRFIGVDVPVFTDALNPLSDFLGEVQRLAPEAHILFVLDEFDELPAELYKKSSLGRAFFLTLRSISGKGPFGFVLVGGEKMRAVIDGQGDTLNKFDPVRVDYFDKSSQWTDYCDLVRRPVHDWLDVSDKAVALLWETSAGNPYYTKLLCREAHKIMVERRDCHLTEREVEEAVRNAIDQVASNSFQHFWEDGILESPDHVAEVSMHRKRILLSYAKAASDGPPAKIADVAKHSEHYHLDTSDVEREIDSFDRRRVLSRRGDSVSCVVPLFERWLRERGLSEIAGAESEVDELARREARRIELAVRPDELNRLVEKWGPYRGREIGAERVRAWLAQFGDVLHQRAMLTLLQGVRFYSQAQIRAKLREAHSIVQSRVFTRVKVGQRKQSNTVVSYVDGPGKSGANFAQLYADENRIYANRLVEKSLISKALEDRDIQAVVFVDDFIGTGDSATDYLRQVLAAAPDSVRTGKVAAFYIAVTGFESGRDRISSSLEEVGWEPNIHVCDPMSEKDQCFADGSLVLPDKRARMLARDIALDIGGQLVPNAALGYGDLAAAVVFETGCPNNTLPILWKESKNWVPLFPRF